MDLLGLTLLIETLSKASGVDPLLSQSVVKVESNYNHKAVGSVGEIGLFQVRPEFVKSTRKQLYVPYFNTVEGLALLKQAESRCRHQKDLTWVVCYNLGVRGGNRINNPKTQSYYKKVMNEYRKRAVNATNHNKQRLFKDASLRSEDRKSTNMGYHVTKGHTPPILAIRRRATPKLHIPRDLRKL